MKSILKNTVILLAIALVSSVALSFVYEITKEPIARAEQQAKAEAYQQVYADAASFDTVVLAPTSSFSNADALLEAFNADRTDGSSVQEVLAANDGSGSRLGYVLTVQSTKGYGGTITIALGIDNAGTVVGYAVLSHSESPGFGANCVNADVREQFIGITAAEQIDGISGATFTTKALRAETQAALDLVKLLGGEAA